jgi:hypothetical protein
VTGIYVRVFRADRWQNLEIDELADGELETLHKPPHLGWSFACALAAWIRDNVRDVPKPALEPDFDELSRGEDGDSWFE